MRATQLLTTIRRATAAAATLLACLAVSPVHATNASAQVAISNVTVSISALDAEPWVTGNWPWIVQNTEPNWPATSESTVVVADIVDAALHQEASGWLGTGRTAAVSAANASASSGVGFAGSDLYSPGAAWSFASASSGESASAVARLWDAAFMVGARTQVVVSMTVDQLSAVGNGGTATALASLGMWSGDFGTDLVNAEAQVIDSPDFSLAYDGPFTLSVTWRNSSSDLAVAQVSLLTSAQVLSAVPEPASALLMLAGLIGLAALARQGRQTARADLAN